MCTLPRVAYKVSYTVLHGLSLFLCWPAMQKVQNRTLGSYRNHKMGKSIKWRLSPSSLHKTKVSPKPPKLRDGLLQHLIYPDASTALHLIPITFSGTLPLFVPRKTGQPGSFSTSFCYTPDLSMCLHPCFPHAHHPEDGSIDVGDRSHSVFCFAPAFCGLSSAPKYTFNSPPSLKKRGSQIEAG